MRNADPLSAGRALIIAVVALVAASCAAVPGSQRSPRASLPPPTRTPLFATAFAPTPPPTAGGCVLSAENDEFGSGTTYRGRGFPPDVTLEMAFTQGGVSVRLNEEQNPELHTDASGAFEIHLFADRSDIGRSVVSAAGGGCVATLDLEVAAAVFPEEACIGFDRAAVSGGDPADEYAAAVLAEEPLAYWRFEEELGRDTDDEAGANHAALFGEVALAEPGFALGSRSILLFGGGGMIDVPDLELATDFTVEAWLQLCGDEIGARDVLIADLEGANLNMAGWHARLWNGDEDVLVSDEIVDRAGWMHLAVTRTVTAVELFQDGVSVATGELAGPLRIDALGSDGSEASLGAWLDEVAVYEHALTADEIAAHAAFGE